MDPFAPLKQDDVLHINGLLAEIHQQFIDTVTKGRGERLSDSPELFSGYVWSGAKSLELGLVDALGSVGHVAREIIGAEDIVDFTPRRTVLDQFARKMGASVSEKIFTNPLKLF